MPCIQFLGKRTNAVFGAAVVVFTIGLLCVRSAKIRRSRASRRHRTHFSIVNLSHQFISFSFFLSNFLLTYCATDNAQSSVGTQRTKSGQRRRVASAPFKCKMHVSRHEWPLAVFSSLFSDFFYFAFFFLLFSLCFETIPFVFWNALSIVFTSNHCCRLLQFWCDDCELWTVTSVFVLAMQWRRGREDKTKFRLPLIPQTHCLTRIIEPNPCLSSKIRITGGEK